MRKLIVRCQFCGEPGNAYSDGQRLCEDCYRIVKPKRRKYTSSKRTKAQANAVLAEREGKKCEPESSCT